MQFERVTIRNIQREAICALRETARFNKMSLGEAATAAITAWVDGLDEANRDEMPAPRR